MAFALDYFVPENVITALIIDDLRKKSVFQSLITSTNRQGVGKSFRVPGVGSITVGNYTGADITIQDLADTGVDIDIDQAKYFAFYLDKVDNSQAAMNVLPLYVAKATDGLVSAADAFIASTLNTDAGISVTGGAIDESNVAEMVLEFKLKMDLANVPSAGRWLAVPPEVAAWIAQSNIETASTTSEAARSEGWIQRYLGFDIYMSNNMPVDGVNDTKQVLAGVRNAFAFVDSVNDLEFGRSEKRFADYAKGLHVYGGATILPDAVAKASIDV